MPEDLKALRHEMSGMAGSLFDLLALPFEESTELERQVIAAFAFGMTFAQGRRRGLTAPEVHALALALLGDVFKYADHQAADFTADLIEAASDGARDEVMNAIIHQRMRRRTMDCSGRSRRKRWSFAADLGVVSSEGRNISAMIRAGSSGRPRWSESGRATPGG